MDSNVESTFGTTVGKNLLVRKNKDSRSLQVMSDNFMILGDILQQPTQFFNEIREGVSLSQKTGSLFGISTIFLLVYGAVLGSGHPLLSLNAAIAVPLLLIGSLLTCVPVMYLFDVLSGSQRSLGQMMAVLLTSMGMASTVFVSFAPIMILFRLAGNLKQEFWLNIGIIAIATLVGLIYVTEGLIKTAKVDMSRGLSKINQHLHFVWMLLYLMVVSQMAWGLLQFFLNGRGGLFGLIY